MTNHTETIISIQPGQPDEGMDYNPAKPLPYPIHVGPDDLCENVPGYALARQPGPKPRLLGFQITGPDPDPVGMLMVDHWRSQEHPEACEGLWPVFLGPRGEMFNLDVPIRSVHVDREPTW